VAEVKHRLKQALRSAMSNDSDKPDQVTSLTLLIRALPADLGATMTGPWSRTQKRCVVGGELRRVISDDRRHGRVAFEFALQEQTHLPAVPPVGMAEIR